MAVIGYPLDRRDYLAADAGIFHCTRTDGIFSSDTDYIVTAPGGMRVTVSTGVAWLRAYEFGGQVAANREPETLDLEVSDPAFRRIDRVVIRFDKLLLSTMLAIKVGEPAVNPVAPPLTRDASAYELGICDITVNAGVLEITGSSLIDTRLNENLCGIMRDDVTRIPTQTLYDAWWAWFRELQIDAEDRAREFVSWADTFTAQSESDFAQWFNTLKNDSESNINEWLASFKLGYSDSFSQWYNDTRNDAETQIHDLLDGLRGLLDEETASALYNKIDSHERLTVADGPVHGLRIKDGKLQALQDGGWVVFGEAKRGLSVNYINNLGMTIAGINLLQKTVSAINNSIEREAE